MNHSCFVRDDDALKCHTDLQIIVPELILGKIYQKIGFPNDGCPNYFKNLVLSRLVYPGSKLKTINYFKQHLNMDVSVYSVYRFLDELNSKLKPTIEQISFEHTKKILKGKIGVVFYDMTTLYFEATEEDDYRIPGFSKDGKHQQPQIMIGLLVGSHGYPIGYQIFEGNTSETKTLIPILEVFQKKFGIDKPIIVADAAMLSQKNIDALRENKYEYILGGRIKNETEQINNRGYNKYLKLSGEINVTIDYEKYEADSVWDGLKGYVTNTSLSRNKVIENYSQLWQVEKAFRISKTDLRIRPIYHRLKNRIEAHICICFSAYAVYKELERLLKKNSIELSPEKAIDEIKEIRQLQYILPKSKQTKTRILKPTQEQSQLLEMKI
ncbi:MAG: IS1634 family transposase [Bacteroidales bacterium]|nr:IS1634 family transposase [Bacteroidales bacterium]